jgi:hypothetical protein
MLDVANKSAKRRFDAGILTTFGKLDTFDIEKVDGRPDQLLLNLMKYYGWSSVDAQRKVDQFMRQISNSSL